MSSSWTKRLVVVGMLTALGGGGALAQGARERTDRTTERSERGGEPRQGQNHWDDDDGKRWWDDDDDGRGRGRGHDDDDDGRGRRHDDDDDGKRWWDDDDDGKRWNDDDDDGKGRRHDDDDDGRWGGHSRGAGKAETPRVERK